LPVCRLDRLTAATPIAVRVGGVELLLILEGGKVTACERACPHEQADLARGRVHEGRLVCPHHAASFSLADGSVSPGWPTRALRLYQLRNESGDIFIDADALRPTRRG
jgi:3-phenylpropionate/trans-cinnamate dioxygenase ferredoxin subunit